MPKMFMSKFEATSNFSNNTMSLINTTTWNGFMFYMIMEEQTRWSGQYSTIPLFDTISTEHSNAYFWGHTLLHNCVVV